MPAGKGEIRMISFEPVRLENTPWETLDAFEDRMIFQTRPWLEFISSTQGAAPVVVLIRNNGKLVGCFTGFSFRKMGVKLLASPFTGWTTPFMGFNLSPEISFHDVLAKFHSFAFEELGCRFFQVIDRKTKKENYAGLPYTASFYTNLEFDLNRPENEIFSGMESACRRCIRKAEKIGVLIEEASDPEFADDYYPQLQEVFRKHALVPTYGIDRVRELITHLQPTGHLLLLRARDPEGHCIATGIFPGFNRHMHFFGGASWRKYQILRPNEALMWYAMKYWKNRGATTFDMGGWAPYKKKYGAYEMQNTLLMAADPGFLIPLRDLAHQTWRRYHRSLSWIKLRPRDRRDITGEDETREG
ncbi:MAG: GNAT family N-acetyltransferase [Deltaproteobacteria bacterium]|nr:GNAT family N-acetyltransferase [Deltaproteobacteria bacterium]